MIINISEEMKSPEFFLFAISQYARVYITIAKGYVKVDNQFLNFFFDSMIITIEQEKIWIKSLKKELNKRVTSQKDYFMKDKINSFIQEFIISLIIGESSSF
jgi:hypothetical protein